MKKLAILVLLILAAATQAVAADKAMTPPKETVLTHYEAIRQALLHDTMKGVPERAAALRQMALETTAKGNRPRPVAAGSAASPEARLMQGMARSAETLSRAPGLKEARTAFGDLSAFVVDYSRLGKSDKTVIVHCPMANKDWVQPAGEIGNPYYGQSMARCGSIVSK